MMMESLPEETLEYMKNVPYLIQGFPLELSQQAIYIILNGNKNRN